ncbi:SgrR family transcriptional regulator [Paenibacillus sp. PastF-3]|uniref:ABC transporter substrate-binding protein n=1 Tax=Paenibacillus sp. PastF-3 TaxID=2940626 RepID=UPI0024765B71|nr:ABC transporter substrate-binding protein [Paenibacillus sp. PastF-3]MDH6371629.1 SgrR family transcriptional regulator [Paenibacillus sp. PastF-3]
MDHFSNHFLCLAIAIPSSIDIGEGNPVTIDRLASILCCTPRNVKFILRKLEEQGFIHWQPGRGRGNISQLTFLRTIEEVLEDSFQELVNKGKLKEAIELLSRGQVSDTLKERLLMVLNKQMGFRSETESTSGLDVLRITRNRHMEVLDPAYVYTAFESYLLGQIYSTLVTYDAASDTFLPGLAHMWETNEDSTSYIFYLRKGVRFHHGKIMTSRDVKETFQRLIDLNSPALSLYKDIERVEIEGDHRIRFELSRPNLFFLHMFSCIHMSILPHDVDLVKEVSGTGPYRLLDLNEDVLVLAAFDYYYGIRPLLDRVEIWYLPEQASNERLYELPESAQEGLLPNIICNHSIDYPALGCRYLLFNFHKDGIHQHQLFRQAIRILYSREALIKELGGNRSTPADSFLPWESSKRSIIEPTLEHARELLVASGYQGETLRLATKDKKEEREEALWLQARAASVGLHIELYLFNEFNSADIKNTAEILLAEEVLEDDWQWGMVNYFNNKLNYLFSLLRDEQILLFSDVLTDFTQSPKEERIKLLDQAEGVLRDNYWVLYGCHMNKKAQLNQSLFGLHTSSFGFLDISKLWIKTTSL